MDCSADAILLTIDGAATSMEGNIARLFQRQYPEAWEEIEYDIDYPLPLGRTLAFDVHEEHECPFKTALVASGYRMN